MMISVLLKRSLRGLPLTAALALGLAQLASGDTVTDTDNHIQYTATSNFVAGAGNTYNVFLNISPQVNSITGFLTAVDLQFKTGSHLSTSVILLSAPGGTAAWSTEIPGGISNGVTPEGCNGNGANSGSVCFQNLTAATPVPGGPYNFQFAVTMPGSDILTESSDIKASYNSNQAGTGKNAGITSQSITIQHCGGTDPQCGGGTPPPSVPEPSSVFLLGTAGLGFAMIFKKRFVA